MQQPMFVFVQATKMDCSDYAVYNYVRLKEQGYAPEIVLTKSGSEKVNHVIVVVPVGDWVYVYDNDKVFRTPRPRVEERPDNPVR